MNAKTVIGLVLPSGPGYSETFFRSKINGLQQSGFKVIVFCSHNPEKFDDCEVLLLPRQYKSKFRQLLMMLSEYFLLIPHLQTVKRFVQLERSDNISWTRIFKRLYNNAPMFKEKLDWLHFGFGTLVMDCQNVAKASKAKMAVSFRGFDIGVYPIKHKNCYLKTWEVVDKIHVISNDIEKLVYHEGFSNQAPIVKITPAINLEVFTEPNDSINRGTLQIITVARLHWKKGLDYTLEALALLKKENVDFQYRIIGSGSELEALKFACHQLNLQENVTFLGKLKHSEVTQRLENSDIYLQYSVQEGFCNAVLEAQAMGLLCIVSDAEGLSENVIESQTGWVVPKRDPLLLKKKIKEVIALSDMQKQSISTAATSRVKKEFNLADQVHKFQKFYDDCR